MSTAEPADEELDAEQSELEAEGTTLAAKGTVYVCGACGKRSRTRYGFDANDENVNIDPGWDESCMMNAVLCHEGGPPWRAVTSEAGEAGR